MRSAYEERLAETTNIERAIVQGNARLCSEQNFGKCWKALFPFKPAEELASRIGCAVRTAAYELSGEREPSARSISELINLVVPRRK